MRINFFEEFPIEENLAKAKFLDFPSTVFVAAHSIKEFSVFKKRLEEINPKIEVAYWPILPNTYWISPFSNTSDLKNLFQDLKSAGEPLKVLIDLELPMPKQAGLYVKNIFKIYRNKKIIKKFFEDALSLEIDITTAEYAAPSFVILKLYRKIGISYDNKKYGHKSCIMFYTSMIPKMALKTTENIILKVKKEINPEVELGLGTIAIGILGNEPILSAKDLGKDLKFMKENNFKVATIFRLGGLNQEYYEAIKQYAD